MRTRTLLIAALGASLTIAGCGAPAGGEDDETTAAENNREEEDED